jgi:hypothetical protein
MWQMNYLILNNNNNNKNNNNNNSKKKLQNFHASESVTQFFFLSAGVFTD